MPKTIASGFGATKAVIAHSACSYQYCKGVLSNMFFSFPPFLQTAAGMSSTATELANWVIALQGMQLLKQSSSLKELWAPAILNDGTTGGFSRLLNYIPMTILLSLYLPISQALFRMVSWMSWQDSLSQIS